MKTAEEIAEATLDAHAIKPHWRRDGEQIAALIAEAIEADRSQRTDAINDLATRVYDALMAAGKRALADEVAEAAAQSAAELGA